MYCKVLLGPIRWVLVSSVPISYKGACVLMHSRVAEFIYSRNTNLWSWAMCILMFAPWHARLQLRNVLVMESWCLKGYIKILSGGIDIILWWRFGYHCLVAYDHNRVWLCCLSFGNDLGLLHRYRLSFPSQHQVSCWAMHGAYAFSLND